MLQLYGVSGGGGVTLNRIMVLSVIDRLKWAIILLLIITMRFILQKCNSALYLFGRTINT